MYLRTSPRGLNGWGLGDTSEVQGQIVLAANKYGIDPVLALAVAQQESGYKQTGSGGGTLKSSAGALGVMQLMPTTAAGLGVNPNDQTQNIDGGVRLLSQLLQQFGGDKSKALAAYNAGPGAVQKYGGVPPYPETQNYVSSILSNYQRAGGSTAGNSDSSLVSSGSGDSSSYPTGIPSADSSYPTGTGYDFASLLPASDASYSIGGVVLSGNELLMLAGVTVAGLALLAIL